MSRLCRGNAPHFCANCGSTFEAKTDEDLLQNAVSPPPASGEVERLLAEKDRQIETLTQALAGQEQRERNAWEAGFRLCRAYGDNHHHFDGEQKERHWRAYWTHAAISGASRPTEGGELTMSERETALQEIRLAIIRRDYDTHELMAKLVSMVAALPPGDAPQTCEWRDIATAPKDGTEVMLVSQGRVVIGLYASDEDEYFPAWSPAWVTQGHGGSWMLRPTHWMPLPAPPQKEPIRPPVEGQTP